MSKEFQTIKDRDDIKRQLREFFANSLSRAVSLTMNNLDLM